MNSSRRTIFILVALLLVLPTAAAQEVRSGGVVVIEQGETIQQDLVVSGGTVTVRGTVQGDVNAAGGTVEIPGNVTGSVTAVGGTVTVGGDIGQNVSAFAGTVEVMDTATINNAFEAAAGSVSINGSIADDARVQAEQLTVGQNAQIGGDLVHATQSLSLSNDATVNGSIESVENVEFQRSPVQTNIPGWAFTVYGFFVNLIFGLILLLVLPRFSIRTAERVVDRPFASFVVGALSFIIWPILIGLLAITVIGLPLAFIALLAYLIALWAGSVYGGLGIGAAVLGLANVRNRWLWLIVGTAIVFLLGAIPFVGGLIHFIVILLGLGALVLGAR